MSVINTELVPVMENDDGGRTKELSRVYMPFSYANHGDHDDNDYMQITRSYADHEIICRSHGHVQITGSCADHGIIHGIM